MTGIAPEYYYQLQNRAHFHNDPYKTTDNMFDAETAMGVPHPHWWADFFMRWGPQYTFLTIISGMGGFFTLNYLWPHFDFCYEKLIQLKNSREMEEIRKIEKPEDLWLHEKSWHRRPFQTYGEIRRRHDREVKLYQWAWRKQLRRMTLSPPKPDEFTHHTFADAYHLVNRLPEPLRSADKPHAMTIFKQQAQNRKEIENLVQKIQREENYLKRMGFQMDDYQNEFEKIEKRTKILSSQRNNNGKIPRIQKMRDRDRRLMIGVEKYPRRPQVNLFEDEEDKTISFSSDIHDRKFPEEVVTPVVLSYETGEM